MEGKASTWVQLGDQRTQRRNLLSLHREGVRARAQDGVQQHDERRLVREVEVGVLEAEVQVVQEGAIRVLHVEVTLLDEEVEQLGTDLGQLLAAEALLVGSLYTLPGGLLPLDLLGDPGPDHEARELPLQRVEDRSVQVEVRDGTHLHGSGVVSHPAAGDGCLNFA